MKLYEKHRPATLEAVTGQDKAVARIRRLMDSGIGGQAIWLSGASGTGKTTLARIVAQTIADPFYVTEFDSADDVNAAAVESIRQGMHLMALGSDGRGGRAWIVNEAHGLRRPIIRQLLGILERLPAHCVVIFTTTRDGEESLFEDEIDAHPLLSRCVCVKLTNQGLADAFAERAREIAVSEGLDGQPIGAYKRLAQRCRNNLRAMLQSIEAGELAE